MDVTKRQALAALVLAISGISAIAVPFVLHSPPSAGDNNANNNTNDNNAGDTGTTGASDNPTQTPENPNTPTIRIPNQIIQDLAESVSTCQTDNHGSQRSLQAKVDSAIRAKNSAAREHHLEMLMHRLETPSVEKHASACISSIEAIVNELI